MKLTRRGVIQFFAIIAFTMLGGFLPMLSSAFAPQYHDIAVLLAMAMICISFIVPFTIIVGGALGGNKMNARANKIMGIKE